MATKRKYTSCSLKDTVEVLRRLDNVESASKLAAEFSVGNATITDWKKTKLRLSSFVQQLQLAVLKNPRPQNVHNLISLMRHFFNGFPWR